ncbi:MAG TPA: radical SAM protein [Methanobacteriaceae archaeon]|nr:radical SAM protein [Methanobacteriaceae archaeon]
MDLQKLKVLGEASQYDLCNYVSLNQENFASKNLPGIYNARTTSGCSVPLFKTLMSNHCANDCVYCINHCQNKFDRLEYSPEELISVFLHYYQNHYAEGLFLSSGMPGDPDKAMENLVEVARKLRKEHEYQGYIHLKIIPGASYDLIKRSMELADRVSVNLESATAAGFSELTSTKDYQKDVLRRMKWIHRLKRRYPKLAPSGQSTQLIVGANLESDEDVLNRAQWLNKHLKINLSYLSPFMALEGTPLHNNPLPDSKRVPRLYQAQFLLNSYGFDVPEIILDDYGNLILGEDPKYLWAQHHPEEFPVEVNECSYRELIRVPGIGPKSARRIIESRKAGRYFTRLEELKNMGIAVKRAEPFIKLNRVYQSTLDF